MSTRDRASIIIRRHALWAAAAGIIPIPLLDLAAVTAIQLDMLKQLSEVYGRNYDAMRGKAFVSALTGAGVATIATSLVKTIPGFGSIVGGVSGLLLNGASTYAVGEVTADVFESGRDIGDIDPGSVRDAYRRAFDEGKQVVSEMQQNPKTKEIFDSLEQLHKLRESGAITEAEYEAQKQKLLERL